MKELERRINKLEQDLQKRKKELAAIERAKNGESAKYVVEVEQKKVYYIKCGNCLQTLWADSLPPSHDDTRWYFCPYCGIKLEE